ncbi:unnamed protein product [Rotaria magnacalcarata]|uniref:Retinoblastoma-associated protein A-box domain-containing protein n=2 Tax=Rotaria magnacalcarata TaxID=392030 RepID=A0A816ZRQ7_9BILA|nr:unnamed protein product [Rotaria magnacalcarata]
MIMIYQLISITLFVNVASGLRCKTASPSNCLYSSACTYHTQECPSSEGSSNIRGGVYCLTIVNNDPNELIIGEMGCMYDQETSKTCKNQSQCIMNYTNKDKKFFHCCCDKDDCNQNFFINSSDEPPRKRVDPTNRCKDDLIERLNEWENIFNKSYDSIEEINNFNKQLNPSRSCQSRFDLSLKLIYNSLENILTIEKKRLESIQFNSQQQIQQSFQKLILNNQFLKSLLGLCILLVLYSHNDKYHDFNWLLNIYSLHGYSFLKIIQIFLKTSQQISKCRQFIKYLSSIEEIIISSMDSLSPNNHLTPIFIQSPNKNNVSRKLLQSSTATTITPNQFNNNLSLIRSQSDGIVEKTVKLCPYSMFYRRLYDLVSSRLDILCLRLFSSQSNQIEKLIWNFFIYLFENYLELLFRSRDLDQILLSSIYFISNSKLIQNNQELTWTRLIQSYKSMPNAKLKTLRSVFIRSINQQNDFIFHQDSYRENPCLTPSKPAGTIHIIDGNMFGDITSFYKEIFLKIDNLEKSFENYLKTIELIEISNRMKPNENQKTTNNISINIGQNIFIDYSSNKIQSNLFSSNNLKANSYQTNSQNKSTSNVLSSSIQAGANNTVRTTRIQTEDGKFLTTISTISKLTIVMIFKKIFLLKKLKPIFYLVNPIIIQLNEHFLKIQTQIV